MSAQLSAQSLKLIPMLTLRPSSLSSSFSESFNEAAVVFQFGLFMVDIDIKKTTSLLVTDAGD